MSARNTAIRVEEVLARAIWEGDAIASLGRSWETVSNVKRDKYRRIANEALEALKQAWADPTYDENDPNAGHRFKISVQSAGSSSVVGDTDHTDDADGFNTDVPPLEAIVRAWNLRDALLVALGVSLDTWANGRIEYERRADRVANNYDGEAYGR